MPAPFTAGRAMFSLVGFVTAVGCYIADFNETHVWNPNWPPHAKFHNGQTMSMGLCLGLSTLYYTWKSTSTASASMDALNTTTLLASLYWVTQMSAILYPGSKAMDQEFGDGFPQAYLCAGLFTIIGFAYRMESFRISGEGGARKKL